MTQEKPTTLRLLPHHKKSAASPFILVFVGFLAGILLSGLLFLLFAQNSNRKFEINPVAETENSAAPINHEINTLALPRTAANTIPSDQVQQDHEDDDAIQQPKDSDLSRLFKHAPAVPAVLRSSPLETQTAASPRPATPIATRKAHSDQVKVAQDRTSRPTISSEKTAMASTASEEIEQPHASVEMIIPPKLFEVQ